MTRPTLRRVDGTGELERLRAENRLLERALAHVVVADDTPHDRVMLGQRALTPTEIARQALRAVREARWETTTVPAPPVPAGSCFDGCGAGPHEYCGPDCPRFDDDWPGGAA